MATNVLRLWRLSAVLRNLTIKSAESRAVLSGQTCVTSAPLLQGTRSTSFFVKHTADELWKGVTSVSNAGRKRGRGKRRSRSVKKNLNKGQVIGVGKLNMVWPGLNAPVLQGKEIVERRQLPADLEREERLLKLRDESGAFRSTKLTPLERGFSGTKWPGRSIGPPDPVLEEQFEGFDTKVLELKGVFSMTAAYGRKRRVSAFVVTGNKQGCAGIGHICLANQIRLGMIINVLALALPTLMNKAYKGRTKDICGSLGDKIAQLICEKAEIPDSKQIEDVPTTEMMYILAVQLINLELIHSKGSA